MSAVNLFRFNLACDFLKCAWFIYWVLGLRRYSIPTSTKAYCYEYAPACLIEMFFVQIDSTLISLIKLCGFCLHCMTLEYLLKYYNCSLYPIHATIYSIHDIGNTKLLTWLDGWSNFNLEKKCKANYIFGPLFPHF